MKLCDLSDDSKESFCEFVRTADHDEAWKAIYDANRFRMRRPIGSNERTRLTEIIDTAEKEYAARFGNDFVPF